MKEYYIQDIDARMYLRDETDIFGLVQTGNYEPEETALLKSLIKKDDVCMDIGANIGYYTILMAKLSARVFAYEPEPSNFELLLKNLELNNIRNVEAWMNAVYEFDCAMDLFICDSNHGMHRLFKSRFCDKPVRVQAIALDLHWRGYPRLDFVKMDVEGSELSVLKGMYNLFNKLRPKMLIEFHPPTIEEKGDNAKDLYDFIKRLGYKISLAPSFTEMSYTDLDRRTRDEMGGQNILCLPV